MDDRQTEVTLVVREVLERHYMDYTLKASNLEGSNSTVIAVVEQGEESKLRTCSCQRT